MSSLQKNFKLAIVGNQFAGKTSFIIRASDQKWIENTLSGIALDFRTIKDYPINNELVSLHIYDVAGLAINNQIAIGFIKDALAIAIGIDLNQLQRGLESLDNWFGKVRENAKADAKVIILGMKYDGEVQKHWVVENDQAINNKISQLQQEFSLNLIMNEADYYFKTSAKQNLNVSHALKRWVQEASTTYVQSGGSKLKVQQPKKSTCC